MKMEGLTDRVPPSRLTLSPVLAWGVLGLLFTCFSLSVFGAWILSPEFAPLALSETDAMPRERLLMLRVLEVLSVLVALAVLYAYLLRPWLKTGHVPLEGLLLIGALITYVLDTTINFSDYHMAWNKHSFNMGTWGGFFPGHTGPTQYAEAWLWGPPMYMYFGVALASIQLLAFRLVRPRLGVAIALVTAFAVAFLFDLIAESAIIQLSEAYAWPYTIGALSLWAGTQFQFPLYEALLVAIYASLYSWLMYSARHDGTSFIERGATDLPAAWRLPARLFAATGFAALCTAIYFGGFYAFSQFADSWVEMPAYLMYADESWQPPSR
ncbi:MAG: spirocyclase AveC family protein [Pseudomonadaceae bacterium]